MLCFGLLFFALGKHGQRLSKAGVAFAAAVAGSTALLGRSSSLSLPQHSFLTEPASFLTQPSSFLVQPTSASSSKFGLPAVPSIGNTSKKRRGELDELSSSLLRSVASGGSCTLLQRNASAAIAAGLSTSLVSALAYN